VPACPSGLLYLPPPSILDAIAAANASLILKILDASYKWNYIKYHMSAISTKHQSKKSSLVHRKAGQWTKKKEAAGLVDFYIHHDQSGAVVGEIVSGEFTPFKVVQVIQNGLAMKELEDLQTSIGLPMEKLFPLLGISKATHHRRKASGKLDAGESDRVVRFARLMGKAIAVMESEENARQWLNSPQVGLGGAVPLAFAATEVGAREVEDLLGRIEHGVYS
jgi:putative toxin-antitoxin system antitoxin component (TIGR02293 family)